jgi:hypothetical protein
LSRVLVKNGCQLGERGTIYLRHQLSHMVRSTTGKATATRPATGTATTLRLRNGTLRPCVTCHAPNYEMAIYLGKRGTITHGLNVPAEKVGNWHCSRRSASSWNRNNNSAPAGVSPRHESGHCWGACGVKKSKRALRFAIGLRLLAEVSCNHDARSSACDTLLPQARKLLASAQAPCQLRCQLPIATAGTIRP